MEHTGAGNNDQPTQSLGNEYLRSDGAARLTTPLSENVHFENRFPRFSGILFMVHVKVATIGGERPLVFEARYSKGSIEGSFLIRKGKVRGHP